MSDNRNESESLWQFGYAVGSTLRRSDFKEDAEFLLHVHELMRPLKGPALRGFVCALYDRKWVEEEAA